MNKTYRTNKLQEFFSHIRKNLLLFLPDTNLQKRVQTGLQKQIVHFSPCKEIQTAVIRLRTTTSRQFLLEDCTASQPLLTEIASWPGYIRRFTFLVLLGKRGASLDSQLAFMLGVDSYIHIQDIDQIGILFEQGQKAFLARNKVWIEEQEIVTAY